MAGSGDSEYAGTEPGSGSTDSSLDPAALAAGNGGGNGGGEPGDDRYVRNADGSVALNGDGSPKRKRGRKPGGGGGRNSSPAARAPNAKVSVGGIEALLFSTHAILSAGLKVPEIALSKTEAETLARATAEVAQYYPTSIDPKTIAWVNLATCIGLTYGPRVYLVRSRLDKERKEKPKPGPQPVKPTAAGAGAAQFIPPGMPGAIDPVSDASTM